MCRSENRSKWGVHITPRARSQSSLFYGLDFMDTVKFCSRSTNDNDDCRQTSKSLWSNSTHGQLTGSFISSIALCSVERSQFYLSASKCEELCKMQCPPRIVILHTVRLWARISTIYFTLCLSESIFFFQLKILGPSRCKWGVRVFHFHRSCWPQI